MDQESAINVKNFFFFFLKLIKRVSSMCITQDDLCLMAPCAIALQDLLNICQNYSVIVDLNFNAKV